MGTNGHGWVCPGLIRVAGILALGVLTGAQAPPPDLTAGLIGYWRLDETTGTTAADSAGSYPGTHMPNPTGGPTITTTGLPPAITFTNPACLTFDGANDFVNVGTNAALGPANMSVCFWTFGLATPVLYDGLMAKTDGGNWTAGWGFFYNSATELRFFVNQWDTGVAFSTINPAQWNLIIGTWNGTTVQIYVNGTAGTSGTYSGGSTAGTNPFEIGRVGTDGFNLNCLIDDVRIYNRVLTAAEIALLLNGQPPPTGLSATPGIGSITLNWTAAAGATSYRIQRAPSATGPWTTIGTTGGTTFTDTNVSFPTLYWYRVLVIVPLESAPAGPVSETPLPTPPRTNDHREGLFDAGRCSCGTAAPSKSVLFPALLLLAIAGVLMGRGR